MSTSLSLSDLWVLASGAPLTIYYYDVIIRFCIFVERIFYLTFQMMAIYEAATNVFN